MKKAVVLAGNYGYVDQMMTTIKSVVYHNRNIKFYVLNSDFPREFFLAVNKKLAVFDCEILDARVDKSRLDQYKTAIHYTVFLRYFIADFVRESRAIYLDSDMVITGDLTPLFELDLEGKPVAAVQDYGLKHYRYEHKFNAGLQVIDVDYWRKESFSSKLVEMTNELHDQVPDGDQSILNILFEDNWHELDTIYNYITIQSMFYSRRLETEELPVVIHYLTEKKPWALHDRSLFREVWWFYHDLEWSEISNLEALPPLKLSKVKSDFEYSALIYTAAAEVEHLEYLIKSLPSIQFRLAAPVVMNHQLTSLIQYGNVSLHENLVGLESVIDNLFMTSDILLDINHFEEVGGVVSRFKQEDKPVLAFDNTKHGEQGQVTISHEHPEEMVAALKSLTTQRHDIQVKDISETLDYILENKCSVARFGDGEMDIIAGDEIPYQAYYPQLANDLKEILSIESTSQFLVCLSDVFQDLERYKPDTVAFWKSHLEKYDTEYQVFCSASNYGSTFISRPYMDLVDKNLSGEYFDKLKQIWKNRDIILVEGELTRSGVGNDLFDEAKSIKRILCPSKDAYAKIDRIKEAILQEEKDSLVLLMLGPAAKVLAYQLSQVGYQAIDMGHIDSEYEWFKRGALEKIKLPNKHTAESNFDRDISHENDENYLSQIVADVRPKGDLSALLVLTTDQLESIEYLIHSLPNVLFTIVAMGGMSAYLNSLLFYDNVVTGRYVFNRPELLDSLIESHDLLLDIYHGNELPHVIEKFSKLGKPVLAFDNTKHGEQGQVVFSHGAPEEMVEAIKVKVEQSKQITVKNTDQTLEYILENRCSVIRFGDGEINIMAGGTIPYQTYNESLAQEMKRLIGLQSTSSLLVCLPDVFEHMERYNSIASGFWNGHLKEYASIYEDYCRASWYGSTFLSRPYIDLVDKSVSKRYFDKLKKIWENRDLVIVEGVHSRSGMGNDLFEQANSIRRILCPPKDAYTKIDEIEQTILKESKDRLILLMLGPTAKVLAYRLAQQGYQAIDIGHIDSEYEWFKLGVEHRVKLSHKHTAEFNFDEKIEQDSDDLYLSQIVADLSLHAQKSLLILTHSENLAHIDYLIENLPSYHFIIGTYGGATRRIQDLSTYENVSLYTSVSGASGDVLDDFIEKSDVLLDINHEGEYADIVSRYQQTGKPILAFDTTQHGDKGQRVFSAQEPERFLQAIKDLG